MEIVFALAVSRNSGNCSHVIVALKFLISSEQSSIQSLGQEFVFFFTVKSLTAHAALSHWCIFHRKKAREIVETWAKKFHDAPIEQRVPFLYLANDILQNSRRKGPEFVDEFWIVLPRVLRDNVGSGDESVKNAAYRLVRVPFWMFVIMSALRSSP